ncbi:MAG: hypothetical protein B6243_02120 [Anaerolineaceae bacterium 4572_5.2]|nr:MAG: hypothetical protein B6243_02120 [Anaerolineaceae bacterium 4572_5.2]
MPENKHYLPNLDNVSILAAVIILAYTLPHFVSLPPWQIEIQVLGVYIPIILDFSTIIAILITGLTATGAVWLLHDHPHLEKNQIIVQHWLLPSLTALVLWLSIEQLPFGGQWWIVASASGIVLMLVLVAEYIVLAHDNPYYIPASIGITAISLSLFLILAVALHAAEVRLFFRVPALSFAAGLVLLRIIYLRAQGKWAFKEAIIVFFLVGELAAGLHYWPIKSITFGIALLGLTYAIVELSENLLAPEPKTLFQTILGPILVLAIAWGVAFALGGG